MAEFMWLTLQAIKQDLGIRKTCFGCLKVSPDLRKHVGEHLRGITWVCGKLTCEENDCWMIKVHQNLYFWNCQNLSVKWRNSCDRLYKAIKRDLGIQKTCCGFLKVSSDLLDYVEEHLRGIAWVFGKLICQENRLFKWQKFIFFVSSNFQNSIVRRRNSYDRVYKQ